MPKRLLPVRDTFVQRRKDGCLFPLCHCLLPDKSCETYQLLFQIIDTRFSFPNLSWVTVDFEEALVKALRIWVSKKACRICLIGCKFHFSKAITKRFQGRTKRSKLSEIDNEFLSLFLRTPFMHKENINRVLHGLATVEHSHESFIKYFKKNWTKDDRFNLWNMADTMDRGLISRYTNNGIESFHKGMNRSLSPHPNIGSFLRWAQKCGEERLEMIRNTAPREFSIDSDKIVDELDSKFRWEQMIQSFPTKPEYRALLLHFICQECGKYNCLTGRRSSHLHCDNQSCKFSKELLPYSYVLNEVRGSVTIGLQNLSLWATPAAFRGRKC